MRTLRIILFCLSLVLIIGFSGCSKKADQSHKKTKAPQIDQLSPDAFAKLTAPKIRKAKDSHIKNCSGDQLNRLQEIPFKALASHLSKKQIPLLDRQHLSWLPPEYLEIFSLEELHAWTREDLNRLSVSQLHSIARHLSVKQIFSLTNKKLMTLPAGLFKTMPTDSLHELTTDDLSQLSDKQWISIEPLLTEVQIQHILTHTPEKVSPTTLERLNPMSLSELSPDVLSRMNPNQLQVILPHASFSQITQLPRQCYPLLTQRQISRLLPHEIKILTDSGQIDWLTQEQKQWLVESLSKIRQKEERPSLPPLPDPVPQN